LFVSLQAEISFSGQRFEEKQVLVKKWYFYTSLAIIIAFFEVRV
jgi:hypothetical protein